MDVVWDAPDVNLSQVSLESYRVRVYPEKKKGNKQVHWVPADSALRLTIFCLQPGTDYKIQVFIRFFTRSNLSDGYSEIVEESTLSATEEGKW